MVGKVLGDGMPEPPKSQGVMKMDDGARLLRVKFMAIPGKQFVIRRALQHRLRAAFVQVGIKFASNVVTVQINEGATPAERQQAKVGLHPPAHRWQIDSREPDGRGRRVALHRRPWVPPVQPVRRTCSSGNPKPPITGQQARRQQML